MCELKRHSMPWPEHLMPFLQHLKHSGSVLSQRTRRVRHSRHPSFLFASDIWQLSSSGYSLRAEP